MKKRKITFLGMLNAMLVVSAVLLWNCQPDEPTQQNIEIDTLSKLERHQVQFNHLRFHNDKAYEIISELVTGKDDHPTSRGEDAYSEEYDLHYSLDRIYMIEGDHYQQFSFIVESSESTNNQFENYVLIQFADESFRQFVITYEYTNPEKDEYIFSSIRELNGGSLISRTTGFCDNLPQLTPVTVEVCTYSNCSGIGAGDHTYENRSQCNCYDMDNCTPPSRDCNPVTQYEMVCSSSGSDGGTDDSNNNTGGGGGGNAGGTGDGNTNGDTTGGDEGIPIVPVEDLRLSEFISSLNAEEKAWWDDDSNLMFRNIIQDFLELNDYSDLAYIGAEGQIELELKAGEYNWEPGSGKVAGLEYTHVDQRYSAGAYFLLTDGSIVFNNAFEQKLTAAGDLTYKYQENSNIPHEKFYYIKIPGYDWAEMLFDPDNLADSLRRMLELGTYELGVVFGRYVFPIEDIKIMITGTDFDGVEASRWAAAGFFALGIIPGGKAFRILDDVADAVTIAIRLKGGSQVIDLTAAGLKIAEDSASGVIRLLNSLGVEVARVVDGILTFFYNGFGGNIVTTADKTTTLIGRWADPLEDIWNRGLAKQGENIGGLNILGDVTGTPAEKWIKNKEWLEQAIERGDVIRVTADPVNVNNLLHINPDEIIFNSFDEVIDYMGDFDVDSDFFENLGFYGKEVYTLLKNGYTFDPITYTFKL